LIDRTSGAPGLRQDGVLIVQDFLICALFAAVIMTPAIAAGILQCRSRRNDY
jgi:hypothetical protein